MIGTSKRDPYNETEVMQTLAKVSSIEEYL